MAPKKRPVKTVVTAKKVVEETVKVVVTPEGKENEQVEVISTSTKENKNVEVVTITPDISGQDDDETEPASEPPKKPTIGTPQKTEQKEEKRKGEAKKRVSTKKAKKPATSGGEGQKRKRRRGVAGGEGGEGYKRYVFKVMKQQVHPDMGISGKAMTVINNYMTDMFERLADEAATLQRYSGKRTMSSREVQGAVKLVLPGELGKHAIAEGAKAVTNYVSYVSGVAVKKKVKKS